jgi:DNA repair exonuclease SbcCD ATPase subunit
MIQTINIKNIQSHKDSTLRLSPGINALVGTSNNGKSAILRGLMWAITNRPLGIEVLLSNWAYDKNGKQKDEMSITVEKDNSTLIRRKTKTENEYVINGDVLEAIKTDVPEQVKKFFALSETNIQRQQDAPFLLSQSSGKIAEYFNRIVRLDVIDRVLSNAESSRRKMKNQLEDCEQEEKRLSEKLEGYNWLDDAEKLIEKCKIVKDKKHQISDEKENLDNSIKKFNEMNEKKFPDFTKAKEIVSKIEYVEKCYSDTVSEKDWLEKTISNYSDLKNKSQIDFTESKNLIFQIEDLDDKINQKSDEMDELAALIDKYDDCQETINETESKMEELKRQLPNICPFCGAKMKDGVCMEEK